MQVRRGPDTRLLAFSGAGVCASRRWAGRAACGVRRPRPPAVTGPAVCGGGEASFVFLFYIARFVLVLLGGCGFGPPCYLRVPMAPI